MVQSVWRRGSIANTACNAFQSGIIRLFCVNGLRLKIGAKSGDCPERHQPFEHLLLSFQKFPANPFHDALAEKSEGLVGSEVRPSCAALEARLILEHDLSVPDFGGRKRICHIFFHAPVEIVVYVAHAC
jgi:hypothetical protein